MKKTLVEMVGDIWTECDSFLKRPENAAFAVSTSFSMDDRNKFFGIPYPLMREISKGFLEMKRTLDRLEANENKRQNDIALHQAAFPHLRWNINEPIRVTVGKTYLVSVHDGTVCTKKKDPLFSNPVGDVDSIDFSKVLSPGEKIPEVAVNG